MENGQRSRWHVLNNSPVLKGLAVAIIILFLVSPILVVMGRLDHTASDKAVCVNNLTFIRIAKQAWALDTKAPTSAIPTWNDLKPYLKPYMPDIVTNLAPKCLSGGVYTIGNLQTAPTCTVKGHALE
jgi:hypothetical protein